jgi:hypothetical protein
VTETRGLRRAEFAVAAFGLTAFLLALLFVIDGVRFHNALLLHALSDLARGRLHHERELLLMALILFDGFALTRGGRTLWRGVAAHRRFVGALPVSGTRTLGGRTVSVVPGAEPRAFCSGLLRPRVYVSEGALAQLGVAELQAVVAHEGPHAYSLRALPRREQALGELSADAAAVRRGGKAPLASALLAFPGGVAPERVDRLAGARPAGEVPTAMVVVAGLVIAALVLAIGAEVLIPGHPAVCVPLASAPGWVAVAMVTRFVVLGPAWLGWRRAERFLRPRPLT